MKGSVLKSLPLLIIGFLIGILASSIPFEFFSSTPSQKRLRNLFENHFNRPFSSVKSVEPLTGGMSKQVWKVTFDGNAYVLKLFREKDQILSMLQEGYYTALAAGHEIGPPLLTLDLENQGMIQEYVHTEKESDSMPFAMKKLHALHQLLGYYPYTSFEKRVRALHELNAPVITPFKEAIKKAETFKRKESIALIHGDFHSGQIVGSDDNLMLIDFADCRVGDGLYDVAKYAFGHPHPEEILKQYLNQEPSVEDLQHFSEMTALVYLDIATNRYLHWAATQETFDAEDIERLYMKYQQEKPPLNNKPKNESLLEDSLIALNQFFFQSEATASQGVSNPEYRAD
ncbi:MAG: phosphotransferase [Waddliaceae bacterium]